MKKQMIFLLAIIFSLSFSNFASAINDPIAHWKLDETSGLIAEDSAGDNDGTLINGPIWTTGIIDGALDFDGTDDYVEVNPVGELDFERTEAYTLSAWYRGIAEKHAILSKMDKSIGYRGYDMYIDYGYVQAHIINSWPSNAIRETGTLYPINDFIWHHIVVTYDGSSSPNGLKIYVDGMEETTTVDVDSLSSTIQNSVSFKIAARGGTSTSAHLSGKIDDVRIYDRALSAVEIEELYLGEELELVGLEIAGPDEVAEDSQTQYSAIALYDNNSTADVTDEAVWSVEPNVIADIEAGLLTTEKIFQPEAVTITAQYSEDGNTFDANKAISVFAICPSGSALEFDGVNDYVDCGTGPAITGTGPFSASAWVKTDAAKGQKIVGQRSETTGNGSYGASILADGRVQMHTYNGGYGLLFQSSVTVNDGLWHHVTVVRTNSTDGEIYVDGSLSGTDSGPAKSLNYVPVSIGRGFTGPFYFDGTMDDVRIYDRALSAEEIQMSMHLPFEGSEPNLVACWDFDEGAGQVAHDTSGNGNDGQLGSSPDIDDSDPNWVDSDAPVGICTLEGLVERNVNEALEIKLNILDEILEALAREDASVNILDGLFGELEYGHLGKRDIRRAGQEIHSAIQSEEQAIHSVEKSVGDLEDSLDILTSEDGPPDNNLPNDSRLMKRLLIPLKK